MTGFEEWFSGGILPARYIIDMTLAVHFTACIVVIAAAIKYITTRQK